MSTNQTLNALHQLEGTDLLRLARELGTVRRAQRTLDKGWAHRTVSAALEGEREMGSSLRVVALRARRDGTLVPRYALALAQIDCEELAATPFAQSKLRAALEEVVLLARKEESGEGRRRSQVLGCSRFSLSESTFLYRAVARDYELIRRVVRRGGELSGELGALIQPRTKGQGGQAPRTFAFYARTELVARMLDLA